MSAGIFASDFRIHDQLLADSHRLGRFELCHLLLHRNAAVPWFILVPETEVAEFFELREQLTSLALKEAGAVARFVKQELGCEKINFAAIGNIVPQLHLHVVGRRPDDPCWPAPVWGHLAGGQQYTVARIREIAALVAQRCALVLPDKEMR